MHSTQSTASARAISLRAVSASRSTAAPSRAVTTKLSCVTGNTTLASPCLSARIVNQTIPQTSPPESSP